MKNKQLIAVIAFLALVVSVCFSQVIPSGAYVVQPMEGQPGWYRIFWPDHMVWPDEARADSRLL